VLESALCVVLESMRRCTGLLAIAVAAATAFTLPPPVQTPRLLQAQPESEERRIDPVVGKAIVEKSGFFAAAIVLAILFEKFT
jgi:hypothetical protein